jgi:hypothetical protein
MLRIMYVAKDHWHFCSGVYEEQSKKFYPAIAEQWKLIPRLLNKINFTLAHKRYEMVIWIKQYEKG